jgi:hypothetical protein
MVDRLRNSVNEYCEINKIDNIDEFIYSCFIQGFNIKKYGISPLKLSDNSDKKEENNTKFTEKEILVDDTKIKMLQDTLNKLRKELFDKNNRIEFLEKELEKYKNKTLN